MDWPGESVKSALFVGGSAPTCSGRSGHVDSAERKQIGISSVWCNLLELEALLSCLLLGLAGSRG